MDVLEALKKMIGSGSDRVQISVRRVRRARTNIATAPALEARLVSAETQIREQGAQLARLEADLDESRRLNLRAAELMDITFNELSRRD
jgi:hypothetical protein